MVEITTEPTQDHHQVGAILAQAFVDDPVNRWINPDPRHDALTFRTMTRWIHGSGSAIDLARRDGVSVGAAVWDPPGHHTSALDSIRSLPGFLRAMGVRVRRGLYVQNKLEALRPKEPHWYLAQLGAAVQGVGVGSALLRAGLERVPGPAYLESSNERNVPLYERFGFEVVTTLTLPKDGPTLWMMYRKG